MPVSCRRQRRNAKSRAVVGPARHVHPAKRPQHGGGLGPSFIGCPWGQGHPVVDQQATPLAIVPLSRLVRSAQFWKCEQYCSPARELGHELSDNQKRPAMSGAFFVLASRGKTYRFVGVIVATKPSNGLYDCLARSAYSAPIFCASVTNVS